MLPILIGWIFFGFIYYKFSFDASYRNDLSVVAAGLMACLLGGGVFFASGSYAIRIATAKARLIGKKVYSGPLMEYTLTPMITFLIFQNTLSLIIIFAFSKKISREIDFFDFTRYGGKLNSEPFISLALISAPVLVHYAMIIFSSLPRQGIDADN